MNKNLKSALVVLAIVAGAYLFINWNKKGTLTQDEKNALFLSAMGDGKEEALNKIEELGLKSEFDAYVKAKQEESQLPQSQPYIVTL